MSITTIGKRQEGKGNRALECPKCHNNLCAMTGTNSIKKENMPIPNRKYCFKCDKIYIFKMILTLE